MTTPLAGAIQEVGTVTRVERLGDLVELTVQLPRLARSVEPGQFAQLRCSSSIVPLLRRPFSVAYVDGDRCSFVFDEVGVGTRLLGALREGDALDVLGPLGRPFAVEAARGPVICISGGVGCAPFPILIKALRAANVIDITVYNGASSVASLYPGERFQRGDAAIRIIEATDDGSRGRHGYVTELIDVASLRVASAVFACGPNAMLAEVARIVEDARVSATAVMQASLEAPMGCGFGTCLGCALPMRAVSREPAWALCCTDGPVMDMRGVDWREVLAMPAPDAA